MFFKTDTVNIKFLEIWKISHLLIRSAVAFLIKLVSLQIYFPKVCNKYSVSEILTIPDVFTGGIKGS